MKKLFSILSYSLLVAACLDSLAQNTFPTEGNAGIGTTVPSANLEIKANQANALMLDPFGTSTGKTSEIRFRELKSNGSNCVGLKAPDNIPSNVTWTLPPADGNSGEFLSTDGAGNLIWKSTAQNADKFLSNLNSPTQINQALLPDGDNFRDIGNPQKGWRDIYFTGGLYSGQVNVLSLEGSKNTFIGMNAGSNNAGSENTFTGEKSGFNNSTGNANSINGSYAFYSNTTGSYNSALGASTLYNNTTGNGNVGFGYSSLYSNSTGYNNVANGFQTLYQNSTGYENTACGVSALSGNTTGYRNTAIGGYSLYSNLAGTYNVANGFQCLYSNTGSSNTGSGYQALYSNMSGSNNTANGSNALYSNSTGQNNVASGYQALYSSNGSSNTASGYQALYSNTASQNTATGYQALYGNSSGNYNTADGYGSGSFNDNSSYCTFLGYDADQASGTDFSNATAVGWTARITASDQVRIGNSTVTSIGGYTNWSSLSDGRFKKEIKENVPGLDFINKLRPVTYHLDVAGLRSFLGEDRDGRAGSENAIINEAISEKERIVYSGFVAQEVESAAKEVGYDFSGVDAPKNENDLYGLRYTEFVVPLVKAIQELSSQDEKQTMIDADQTDEVAQLKAEVEELKVEISTLKLSIMNQSSLNRANQKSDLAANKEISVGELGQNIPNPFDNSTIIPFKLPENCHSAYLTISESTTGRIISVTPVSCGQSFITVESKMISTGLYNYSLYVDQRLIDTKQMLVEK